MKRLSYIIIALFSYSFSFGQSSCQLDLMASKVTINGTSSLHDWESTAMDFHGNVGFVLQGDKIVESEDIFIAIVVKSIKSGKSIMDKKTMQALKQSEFPTITFKSIQARCEENQKINCKGNLQVAGASNEVTAEVGYKLIEGVPEVSGRLKLLMTDYGVEPPEALFGTIKTDDEITIDFVLKFNSNCNNLNK